MAQVTLTVSTLGLAECEEVFSSAGDFVIFFAGYVLSAS